MMRCCLMMMMIVVLTLVATTRAANWAQTTGTMKQNTAIPYIPSNQNPHWSARMGMGVAISNVTREGETIFRSQSFVFLIGGDDYFVDAEARPLLDQHNQVHGYQNDVWKLPAPEPGQTWVVDDDMIDKGRYEHKLPKVHSQLKWEQVSPGLRPPTGLTYEEFIQCQDAYPPQRLQPDADCDFLNSREPGGKPRGWFSARRMHQVAIYESTIFVIGGRAREYAPIDSGRLVGGIVGARSKEAEFRKQDNEEDGIHSVKYESSMREASVLKNDVWSSRDWGTSWTLVQPGCHSNQLELLLEDRTSTPAAPKLAEMFNEALRCVTSADCYGNQEACLEGVCVCEIWSPREQHKVAVFNGYMYLVGGLASKHLSYCQGRACGDLDAGGYRAYMNDVWYSKLEGEIMTAGSSWVSLSSAAFSPRGGHAIAIMEQLSFRQQVEAAAANDEAPATQPANSGYALYVMGGQTGDTLDYTSSEVLNDVWFTELPAEGFDPSFITQNGWTQAKDADWAPRTGHTAVVDPPSAANGYSQRVFVVGGVNMEGDLFGDTWSSGWECAVAYTDGDRGPQCASGDDEEEIASSSTVRYLVNASKWRRDYDPEALWRFDSGGKFVYDAGQPQQHYLDGDSAIEQLVRVYKPLGRVAETFDEGYPPQMRASPAVYGVVPRRKPVIEEHTLSFMHDLGIHTVQQLADISQTDVLKLRGYIPQAPTSERFGGMYDDLEKQGYHFDDICNHRSLAIAVLKKCAVDLHMHPLIHYDQEAYMPWNIQPVFVGKTPGGQGASDWKARWHGKYYNKSAGEDEEEQIAGWDGCTDIGINPVNVPSIGDVSPQQEKRDPEFEVAELVCKANPGPRAFHAGVYMDQRVYVMGGLVSTDKGESALKNNMTSTQDMWYRDDRIPRATLTEKPKELNFGDEPFNIFLTAEDDFTIRGDKEGLIMEYMVWDNDEHTIARTWDKTKSRAQVNWLDYWFEKGPGSGTYIFYSRTVDPAGNMDVTYGRQNLYKWKYQTALPWHIIGGCIGGFLGLCLIGYWEYKRRRKKKAMERYAIKRMRRKFKGAQKELAKGGDSYGKDGKRGGKKGKNGKKKKKKSKSKLKKDAQNNKPSKEKDKEKKKKNKDKMKEKEKLKKKKE